MLTDRELLILLMKGRWTPKMTNPYERIYVGRSK